MVKLLLIANNDLQSAEIVCHDLERDEVATMAENLKDIRDYLTQLWRGLMCIGRAI